MCVSSLPSQRLQEIAAPRRRPLVLGCDVTPAALALPVCTRLARGAGPGPAGAGGEDPAEAGDGERCSPSDPQTATVPVQQRL